MFPVASFPCICYRTEDYHCVSVSVSCLFSSPLSLSIFIYEWPCLSVALTGCPQDPMLSIHYYVRPRPSRRIFRIGSDRVRVIAEPGCFLVSGAFMLMVNIIAWQTADDGDAEGASVMCKLPLLCFAVIILMRVQTISTTGYTGRSTASCSTTKRYAHMHPGLPLMRHTCPGLPACILPAPIVHVAVCHQPPPHPPHMALPCPIKQPLQHLKQCKSPLMPPQTRPHHSPLLCCHCTSSLTHQPSLLPLCIRCLSYHAQIHLGGAIACQKGHHEYILCHDCQLFLSLWLPLFIYRIQSTCPSPTTQKL